MKSLAILIALLLIVPAFADNTNCHNGSCFVPHAVNELPPPTEPVATPAPQPQSVMVHRRPLLWHVFHPLQPWLK